MNSIIIEDEKQSAEHLHLLLKKHYPEINVLAKLRSVEDSVEWLTNNNEPDLIFIDIELSDGTCFEILEATQTKAKLLFTTAYDQHALKAFEFNSIAYILKPITQEKLSDALCKVETNYNSKNNETLVNELRSLFKQEYKKRFLVKRGEKFWHIPVRDISYFVSEDGLTIGYINDGRKHFIDYTLDTLEQMIDPSDFFRINRQMIININAIITVKTYFTRRLLLEIDPTYEEDVIVSKERASKFKAWLDA